MIVLCRGILLGSLPHIAIHEKAAFLARVDLAAACRYGVRVHHLIHEPLDSVILLLHLLRLQQGAMILAFALI